MLPADTPFRESPPERMPPDLRVFLESVYRGERPSTWILRLRLARSDGEPLDPRDWYIVQPEDGCEVEGAPGARSRHFRFFWTFTRATDPGFMVAVDEIGEGVQVLPRLSFTLLVAPLGGSVSRTAVVLPDTGFSRTFLDRYAFLARGDEGECWGAHVRDRFSPPPTGPVTLQGTCEEFEVLEPGGAAADWLWATGRTWGQTRFLDERHRGSPLLARYRYRLAGPTRRILFILEDVPAPGR